MHAEFVAISLISHVFEIMALLPSTSHIITTNFDESTFLTPIEQLLYLRKNNDTDTYVLPQTLTSMIKKYCNINIFSGVTGGLDSKESTQTNIVDTRQLLIPLFKECILFVSCEPCIMCASALSLLRMII
jgi:hypothetical protein